MYNTIINQLEKCKKDKIFFRGASLFLEDFLSKNNLEKYNIAGILDNNPKYKGKKLFGYKIYPPKEILKQKAKIIFTIQNNDKKNYESVYKELKAINSEKYLMPNPFLEFRNLNYITNKIYLVDRMQNRYQVSYIPGLQVFFDGNNSVIEIGCDPIPKFVNSKITANKNSIIKIGSSEHFFKNFSIYINTDNSKITIGENFSSEQANIILTAQSDTEIEIGSECMFAGEILIRTTDGHGIYDKRTKKRINKSDKIIIGNKVWVGQRATILKNSKIPDGCIIGANSLINKKFSKKSCVLAGVPAKIVKENILWTREVFEKYPQNPMY